MYTSYLIFFPLTGWPIWVDRSKTEGNQYDSSEQDVGEESNHPRFKHITHTDIGLARGDANDVQAHRWIDPLSHTDKADQIDSKCDK